MRWLDLADVYLRLQQRLLVVDLANAYSLSNTVRTIVVCFDPNRGGNVDHHRLQPRRCRRCGRDDGHLDQHRFGSSHVDI